MNYQELLSSGANVSVTLSPSDLINLLKEINTTSKTEILEPEYEEFISRKNALALLNIDSSTLCEYSAVNYTTIPRQSAPLIPRQSAPLKCII